ncbi:MAG: hypothetical protein R6V01_10770 [Thermoplasmatota archaeon]
MAVSKILIVGLVVSALFLTGVIGLMTTAGHETADEWFGHDHHNGDDREEHHHFYEFWENDHHHDDCHEESEKENGTV